MTFDVLTLFPEMFENVINLSILGRALKKGIIDVRYTNIRDYSNNKFRKVDDYPFGGGIGMIMSCEPLTRALKSVYHEGSKVIYMSPKGKKLTQNIAEDLSKLSNLIIVCGHYEGIDQRFIDKYVDMELSVGDFILTGGEIPAMALIDCVTRLIPGVLTDGAAVEETFNNGLLEYPQYTRPFEFEGMTVPEVLVSGNHLNIQNWRKKKSLERTLKKRPDLLEQTDLEKEDLELIYEIEVELIKKRKEVK